MKNPDSIGIELGPARSGETGLIALMSRDLIERGLGWRWTPQAVTRSLHEPNTELAAARAGGALCGFAMMQFDFAGRSAHLALLAVAPAFRRRGVGRALFRYLEKMARAGGIVDTRLEVRAANDTAQRFYQELGFRSIGVVRDYYEGREDAVRMLRRL